MKMMKKITAGILSFVLIGSILLGNITKMFSYAEEAPLPEGVEKGIDVSSYNGDVDYSKVASQGYTFVMMRIGSGTYGQDSKFAANYSNAKEAGLKVGAYFYSYALTVEQASKEAADCISMLEGRGFDFPIAYDMENEDSLNTGKENVTAMTKTFLDAIISAGYQGMVYSYRNSLVDVFDYETLSNYPVWIANYDVSYPDYPNPYKMWQYTIGSVPGANTDGGQCDVNYLYTNFVEASGVSISQNTLELQIDNAMQAQLSAAIEPENASNKLVKWTSDDEKIATVDANGVVTAVANGTVNIKANAVNGVSASCVVNVTTPATGLEIGNASLSMGKGEKMELEPVLTPATSTDEVTYKSENEKIVKVNKDGSIEGIKKGKATIITTTTSGVTKKVTVTVGRRPFCLRLGTFYQTIKVGESYQLEPKISKGATCNQIKYSSRNEYKASVDENGLITGVAGGYTVISAKTYNNKKAWVIIKVVE